LTFAEHYSDALRKKLPILSIAEMQKSEALLRRGHQVLAWILHTYVHSLPLSSPIRIPPPVTIPLFEICTLLDLPPVHVLSDEVHYNWTFKAGCMDVLPTTQNICSQLTFTGTKDEEEFQLATTRIELRGGEALSLMINILNEGQSMAPSRLASLLHKITAVINDLTQLLLAVRQGCDPEVFYHDVRPWFGGQTAERPWVFEGLENPRELKKTTELSGTSAGQSPLIHALDVFLGVNSFSNLHGISGIQSNGVAQVLDKAPTFLERMRSYMPLVHRAFLRHISANPRPLRSLVMDSEHPEAIEAYNKAVRALKGFRDAHIRIVTLYILGPARRAQKQKEIIGGPSEGVKGTGGTDLATFLKGVRDLTANTVISAEKK
jgi:indoleamine 2,3-dioxygenase